MFRHESGGAKPQARSVLNSFSNDLRVHRSWLRLEALEERAMLALSFNVGDHSYPAGTGVVTIPIQINGSDLVSDTDIDATIGVGDGSDGAPAIRFLGQNIGAPNSGDVSNNFMSTTPHGFFDTGSDNWNILVFEYLNSGATSAQTNGGLLVTLSIDLTGKSAGQHWNIVMGPNNVNGSTDFFDGDNAVPVTVTDGSITIDQPPMIDPNGSDPGTYTNNWSGSGPVSVVDPSNTSHGATITDADDTNLASLTVSVASPAAHDVLAATGQGNVSVSGNGTATLMLTPTTGGLATLADFQATLRTAAYNNTTSDEGAGPKTINFTAVDPEGGIGTASSQILVEPLVSSVTGRFVFYQGSGWDKAGTNPKPFTPLAFSDDNAVATDKTAYIANGTQSTFANVISYDKGINGIMVDLSPGGNHTAITQANILNDFTFKAGNNNSPSAWATVSSPTTVTVRTGMTPAANGAFTTSGSDRVELIWPSGTIKEKWLEVTVMATANTGLTANDVFFYGDALGNSGGGDTVNLSETNSVDELGARNNGKTLLNNIPITNVFDYNRDGLVNSVDQLLARNNGQTLGGTRYLNIPALGPFAPLPPSGDSVANSGAVPAAGDSSGVTSALVSSASSPRPSLAAIPAWILNRLSRVDLNSGPVAAYLEHLAEEDNAKSRAILVKADQAADALDLDDTLLDSLLVRLGLK